MEKIEKSLEEETVECRCSCDVHRVCMLQVLMTARSKTQIGCEKCSGFVRFSAADVYKTISGWREAGRITKTEAEESILGLGELVDSGFCFDSVPC